jgi:hypothetical protein
MKQFFTDVFSGKKTVSSMYNSPEENLYINKVLSVFEKITNTSGLESFPPSTYPKAGIIKLQKATGIDVDGVFGRQALAAAISPPGTPIINPSNYAEYQERTNRLAQLIAKIEREGAEYAKDMLQQSAETDRILAGPKMEDVFEKSLLRQALAKDPTLGGFMDFSPSDIAKIDRDLPDMVSRSQLLQWLKANGGTSPLGDTPESMAALQDMLDQISFDRPATPSVSFGRQSPGSYTSPATTSMNESLTHERKNITERLMERWLK